MTRKLDPQMYQPGVTGKVLEIKISQYEYRCTDGCCYDFGTITTVNGFELPLHNEGAEAIVRQILEHLGYIVRIESDGSLK